MASVLQLSSCALSFLDLLGETAWSDSPGVADYSSDREAWKPGTRQGFQCYKEESSDTCCNTYLSECTNERLSVESSHSETFLYLIYRHLDDFLDASRAKDHLLVLLPTLYTARQLKNFLGVLQAHEKTSIAVLRSPLAYSYALPAGGHFILEVELRQSTIAHISIQDGVASCKEVQLHHEFNLQSLYREWFEIISHEFLKLRYNARHDPQNKQLLFEQLNKGWRTGEEKMRFELDKHKITVDTDRLRVRLPESMQAYISGRKCHLMPSPFGVPEGALTGVETLQRLTVKQLAALFEYVPPAKSETPVATTGRIRHYYQIRHLSADGMA